MSNQHYPIFIREWREARGLTLQAVCDIMGDGFSRGSLSAIESGKATSQKRLAAIAKALDTTPAALHAGPPPPADDQPKSDVDEVTGKVVSIFKNIDPSQWGQAIRVLESFTGKRGA